MPRLSDIIEDFIKQLFEESENDMLEIQRNELAIHFKCAPSQINYVLMTRFNVNRGYYIESRRGGGGSIRITRVSFDGKEYLSSILNEKIGESISQNNAESFINFFLEQRLVNDREAVIMKAAVNDKALSSQHEDRDYIRAAILKSMLVVLMS